MPFGDLLLQSVCGHKSPRRSTARNFEDALRLEAYWLSRHLAPNCKKLSLIEFRVSASAKLDVNDRKGRYKRLLAILQGAKTLSKKTLPNGFRPS